MTGAELTRDLLNPLYLKLFLSNLVMSENPSPSESRPETSEEAGNVRPRETKRAYHLVEHLMPKERIHIGPPPFVGTWEEMNRLPKWEHIEEAIRVLKREEELKHTFNRP
uniref:Uncharacterized protein n=1 Tax=Bursaphelenchus xylophilus TaxID=6326 RepID=A0A1I7SBC6_BURXY